MLGSMEQLGWNPMSNNTATEELPLNASPYSFHMPGNTNPSHTGLRNSQVNEKMCLKSASVSLFPVYCEDSFEAVQRSGGGVGGWLCFGVHSEESEPEGRPGLPGPWQVRPLVQCPAAILCSTQARNLVLLQREFVVVGDLFVECDGLLRVDHNLFLGLYGDNLRVAVWLKEQSNERLMRNSSRNKLPMKSVLCNGLWMFTLTVQQWLMNRARFPHLVASIIVSWSTLNK